MADVSYPQERVGGRWRVWRRLRGGERWRFPGGNLFRLPLPAYLLSAGSAAQANVSGFAGSCVGLGVGAEDTGCLLVLPKPCGHGRLCTLPSECLCCGLLLRILFLFRKWSLCLSRFIVAILVDFQLTSL